MLLTYLVISVGPFLVFVVGLDTKRWEPHYWFSDVGKADSRRLWKRWAVYAVGATIGYTIV